MCSIAGILNLDGAPVAPAVIEAMNGAQAHRGPDGEGVHLDGPIALGHRRLAIIDPEGGQQPMRNEDGTIHVVANGEIYNFRELRDQLEARGHTFSSNVDCEVIVHGYEEWGEQVVERLRGMFAFAVRDQKRQQLFLARDRIGIKPLVYYRSGNCFAFASEIQALRTLPGFDAAIDFEAIDRYLHLAYIPAPLSIFDKVRKLPPAHTLTIDNDGHSDGPRRYWELSWQPDESLSDEVWIERLGETLSESVSSHLVSDVPFGAFLSGGVDSSLIAACMAEQLADPVRTFTIGFDEPQYDERAPAREAAAIIGSEHREDVVGLDALDLLPKLVRHYGEPFGDSSAVCTWRVCEAARRQVPMVLSGDGGDEVFAGYPYFPKMIDAHPPLVGGVRRARRLAGDLLRGVGLLSPVPDLASHWYERSPYFPDSERSQLWRSGHRELSNGSRVWNAQLFAEVEKRGKGVLDRCQSVDIASYLPFDNLTKVDIASMAHGLEVRVPLLDHRLLEVVCRMPERLRLAKVDVDGVPSENGTGEWCGKYALKKAATCFYSWDFLTRRKMGFSMPVGEWFAGGFKSILRERLLDSSHGLGEWFEIAPIEKMIAEHGEAADHGHRLWLLLVLAEWKESLP